MKFIAHWGKVSTLIPETGGNMYRCVEHSIKGGSRTCTSHPFHTPMSARGGVRKSKGVC
jgi:hypothetical protein